MVTIMFCGGRRWPLRSVAALAVTHILVWATCTALAGPPPGYTEVTVREVKYGLGPENLLIQEAEAEGEFDMGPGSFAVDGAGDWYLIDPGRSMIEGKCVIKVFPPKGPVRALSSSAEVHTDPETEMGVTSAGTVIVANPTAGKEVSLSIIPPAGQERTLQIALVNQRSAQDEKPAEANSHEMPPSVFDTVRVELGSATEGSDLLSKADHSIRDIFPAEAKEGGLLGFESLSLKLGRGYNLRVDPEGGVYVDVLAKVRESEPDKISLVSALCRFDLNGKLTDVFPGFVENRQGRLVTAKRDPLYQRHDAETTECALRLHSPSGEVEKVIKLSVPSLGSRRGQAINHCPGPSYWYFDERGRFYIGPLTRYGQFDRFFVHVYSSDGRSLGSGSWPRGTLGFGAASHIQVDSAGNIYFIQFGERSAKLMKWVRQ